MSIFMKLNLRNIFYLIEYYDREEKEKKTVQINTRCTAHTKKMLDEKVKESVLTVSEYITRLIEEGQGKTD